MLKSLCAYLFEVSQSAADAAKVANEVWQARWRRCSLPHDACLEFDRLKRETLVKRATDGI